MWRDKSKPLHHRISNLWNKEYLNAPYVLGGMTKSEGYDCFSLVYTILCNLGCDIKPYWNDYDITNYWIEYDLNLLPEWFRSLPGEIVRAAYRTAGDILLCKLKDQWMLSIYLGPDICSIIGDELGKVGACPYKMLEPFIVEVKRCLLPR